MAGCQPVRVQWDEPRVEKPGANWQLSLKCEGCGLWRQLEVWGPIAEDVEQAEMVERSQLAALHSPPEIDLPF